MQDCKQIVMLGTKPEANGGIASVISAYQQNGLFERRNITYLPTHSTGKRSEKCVLFLKSSVRFTCLLVSRKVALVHVHVACDASFWRKSVFILAAKMSGVPVLLHVHAGHFPDFYRDRCTDLKKRMIRKILNKVEHVAVVSNALNTWMCSTAKPQSIVTIINPATMPVDPKPRLRDPSTILFLGHLSAGKGVYDLVHAMRRVTAIVPGTRLLLCGDGDVGGIKKLIRELGLADAVELPGWVSEERRAELLARSTIFVLPSYAEGLPMSILEAMVSRLPVISTKVGGIPEVIEHERDGLLIAPGHVASLATNIVRLLQRPAEREKLSESAFTKVREAFNAHQAIASLEKLYDDILLSARRRSRAETPVEKESIL